VTVLPVDPRPRLIDIGRRLDARAWVPATAGNLSVRDEAGAVWITASGTHKGRLTPEDFVRVDLDGTRRDGTNRRPSAETTLHLAVYRTHPEAQACLHVHTVPGTLVHRLRPSGAPGLRLPPLELVKAFDVWDPNPEVDVPVFANQPQVPDIAAEVETRFRRRPPEVPGFLIEDHGLTAWGPSLEAADQALEAFEFLFRCMLEARASHLDLAQKA
jgi:methylthioribulose-1-phosphate dehydratase